MDLSGAKHFRGLRIAMNRSQASSVLVTEGGNDSHEQAHHREREYQEHPENDYQD